MDTDSRTAMHEFLTLMTEINEKWAGEAYNLRTPKDKAGANRSMMHLLEAAITGHFESDPAHPIMRKLITPTRKLFGDNPDAIYYDAAVSDQYAYRLNGKTKGAVYFSVTVEIGMGEGGFSSNTAGLINDTQIDVADDGSFEIFLGGPERARNWMALPEGASRVTTRHYYEDVIPAAANPEKEPDWHIECLSDVPLPEVYSEESVAAGIRRVSEFMRSRTIGMPPFGQGKSQPAFVNLNPNSFPKPIPPADYGWSAIDAHYSMTPYFISPEQALIITGRWPTCRMANICLWNRHLQTHDYVHHRTSLNRAQTQSEADGRFRMILAHEDPGLPNWISTQGEAFGLAFWRFMMAEGEVETPTAEVVDFADLKAM